VRGRWPELVERVAGRSWGRASRAKGWPRTPRAEAGAGWPRTPHAEAGAARRGPKVAEGALLAGLKLYRRYIPVSDFFKKRAKKI
jgi:hypothetical protein